MERYAHYQHDGTGEQKEEVVKRYGPASAVLSAATRPMPVALVAAAMMPAK
jgi:hypothetical protein